MDMTEHACTTLLRAYWLGESEVVQLCLTLCYPMDCGLPGSSIHGVFQTRVLEWVAFSFSNTGLRSALNPITGFVKEEKRTQRETSKYQVKMEAEIGAMQLQTKNC